MIWTSHKESEHPTELQYVNWFLIEPKKLPQFSHYIAGNLSDTTHHVVKADSWRNTSSFKNR